MTPAVTKNDSDPFNLYNVLFWLRQRCDPSQKKVYCHFMTQKQLQQRKDGILFSPKRPIGINTIAGYLRELAKKAGIPHWEKVGNHDSRQGAIDRLANDPSVNPVETQKAARHKSLNAQNAYIRATEESDFARQAALLPPTTSITINRPDLSVSVNTCEQVSFPRTVAGLPNVASLPVNDCSPLFAPPASKNVTTPVWHPPHKIFGSSAKKSPPTYADYAQAYNARHHPRHESFSATPPTHPSAYTTFPATPPTNTMYSPVDCGPGSLPHRLTPDRHLQVWDPYARTWRFVHSSKNQKPTY